MRARSLLPFMLVSACAASPPDVDGGLDAPRRDAASLDAPLAIDDAPAPDGALPIPDAAAELEVTVVAPVDVADLNDAVLAPSLVVNAVVAGDAIAVEGTAAGGTAPYVFTWRSDRDGELGTGDHAMLEASEGDHLLTLEVTDAAGLTGEASIPLHVLPAIFDWSHRRRPDAPPAAGDWMTPVRYQDRCGSCWAFAALAVVEAQLNIAAGDPALDVDLSEQSVIDCDGHSLGCIGGGTEQSLSGFLHDVGVPAESCNPFLGGDDECIDGCRDGATPSLYRVEGTTYVVGEGGYNAAVQAWMRYQLVHHGPIARSIVNMLGYDPATHLCAPMGGDHYVAVVGYDHAAGLWIAKNSWGASWNGDGYMEVAYGNCAIDASATIVDAVLPP